MEIGSNVLRDAVDKVIFATSVKDPTAKPIKLFSSVRDGRTFLFLGAMTDQNTSIYTWVDASGEPLDESFVEAKRFSDVVRTLDSCMLNITSSGKSDGYVSLSTQGKNAKRFKFARYRTDVDIPLPKIKPSFQKVVMDGHRFTESVNRALRCVGKTDTPQYALSCVFFDLNPVSPERTSVVVMGASHAVVCHSENEYAGTAKGSFVVDQKKARLMEKAAQNSNVVELYVADKNRLIVYTGSTMLGLQTRAVGNIPDYKSILGIQHTSVMTVSKLDVATALKQVIIQADNQLSSSIWKLDKSLLSVSTDGHFASGEVTVSVEYTGEPMTIKFRPVLLQTVLESLFGEVLDIHMGDNRTIARINEGPYSFFVMPYNPDVSE